MPSAKQAAARHGLPVVPVHAPGFVGSKNLGSRLGGEAVLRHLIGTLEPAETTPFDINLIGEYNVTGDMWQYTPLLDELGIRVLSTLSGDGRVAADPHRPPGETQRAGLRQVADLADPQNGGALRHPVDLGLLLRQARHLATGCWPSPQPWATPT